MKFYAWLSLDAIYKLMGIISALKSLGEGDSLVYHLSQ